MRFRCFLVCLSFSALLGACASTTHYGFFPASRPDETVEAAERGATFPVQAGDEKGTLHVMSLGIVEMKSGTKPVQFPALHLRMIVTNEGQIPWVLNTRDQKVQFAGKGSSIPSYVKSDTEKPPEIQIPPSETRQVELFYPLPKSQQTPETIDGFDLKSHLLIGKEPFKRTIPFVRQPTRRSLKPVYVNEPFQQQLQLYDQEQMSPQFWWYDPLYPGLAFPDVPPYPLMW